MEPPSVDDVAQATGGRYEIERVYAQGGMGTVYAARHRQLGSRLAIKVLPPDVATSSVRLARFKREAALAANLSHPNIVPVFEFDVQRGMAYLVMPLVEGQSLASYLAERGRLDHSEVTELVRELANALGFAHRRGIVHRDIKPANILRESATSRWLITDFGVAHTAGPGDTEITQTGAVVGTPAYMAPEQASGLSNVDGRADLYALAAVAYQALTGAHPDPFAERRQVARALRRARPDTSRTLAQVLTAPLALNRDERPPNAEAWLGQLSRLERRQWPVRPLLAGTALAATALAGWLLLGNRAPLTAVQPAVAVLPFLVEERGGTAEFPLDSLLTQAFDWQLRYIPDHRVLGPVVRQHAVARLYGERRVGLDTLLGVAHDLGATLALAGLAEPRDGDHVFIQIQLFDVTRRQLMETADTAGSLQELNDVVAALVVALFAEQVSRARSGWATSIPKGLDAFSAYWRGQQAFRRGTYPEAIRQFDRVIRLDPTFAPAHFNRVVAVTLDSRPTQATSEIRAALDAASRYRAGLDPTSEQLLAGYEALVRDGDLIRAESMFVDLVGLQPSAADAWFVLGYVQFFFRSLLGSTIGEAKFAFEQALRADPKFAGALLQLAAIAAIEGDQGAGREYLRRFLSLDSTSALAELARMADSLLYRGPASATRVLGSVGDRPTEVLELFSLAAGSLHPPAGTTPLAEAALRELWDRARTPRDRSVAFRMRLARFLATGRYASADSLVRQASQQRLQNSELDRWVVLSAITSIHDLADPAVQQSAAERLERASEGDPEVTWLVARWGMQHQISRRTTATGAVPALRQIALDSAMTSPQARSLMRDVDAALALAAGDTTRAMALWDTAMRRYSIELVPFGLTASLWPLRLRQAALALATGDASRTLDIATTFDEMAGFVDQVAWPHILELRARAAEQSGHLDMSRTAYEDILRLLENANGEGVALRERAARALADLGR